MRKVDDDVAADDEVEPILEGIRQKIVLVEGIVMGLISWTAGVLISLPVSKLMSEQLGLMLIQIPLNYQYSAGAAGFWLVALSLVTVAASWGPARNAVRLTIREVLAYE